jgi:uncharacterized protein with GYD domain
MPKYLLKVSYTAEGVKGVLKDGGTARKRAAEAAVKSTGGSLESMYFAFGDDDVYCIVDGPDNASMAAAAMAIGASGLVKASTVVLLTPEEIDQAVKKTVAYTPPGR